MPIGLAIWAAHTCSAATLVHQLLLAALLVIPNTATAFIFQSYMISVAAVVRRKLHAMKALTHMLTPVRRMPLFRWLISYEDQTSAPVIAYTLVA